MPLSVRVGGEGMRSVGGGGGWSVRECEGVLLSVGGGEREWE